MLLKPVLCSSMAISDGPVPDWVHLLPAGSVRTKDGRGPYHVEDAASLISLSMAGGKLPIDENHATDLAAPKGLPAPAKGWIVELQQRLDGIWGRVEWTGPGRRMMEHREYAGLSPVIVHNKAGVVSAILRASLTNTPNLSGLTSLHVQGGDRAAQLAQIKAGIRQLSERVALHAQAMDRDAPLGLTTPRAVMQRARDLQAELARMGLPIDLASAIASVMDEDADAATASVELDAGDHDMIKRLGLDSAAYLREKSPPPPDPRLDAADLDMIARFGLDPVAYLENKERSHG